MSKHRRFLIRTLKWPCLWLCLVVLITAFVSFMLGYEPVSPWEALGASFVMPAAGFMQSPETTKGWGLAFFTLPLWLAFPLAGPFIVLLMLSRRSRARASSLAHAPGPLDPSGPGKADDVSAEASQHDDASKPAHWKRALILRLMLSGCAIAALLWVMSFAWRVSYNGPGIRSGTYFRLWCRDGVVHYMERPFPSAGNGEWEFEPCPAWQALLAARFSQSRSRPVASMAFLTSLGGRSLPFVVLFLLTATLFWVNRRRWASRCCQTCGYDLTANVSGRCPECGERPEPPSSDSGGPLGATSSGMRLKRAAAAIALISLAIWAAFIPWTARRAVIDYVLASDYARQEFLYHQALATAHTALAATPPDFEQAHLAANKAWIVWGTTSELHLLRRRIDDLEEYADIINQGDAMMGEKRWYDALEAYEKAQNLMVSPEIEYKVRLAHALMLVEDARESMSAKELSAAENDLKKSLWYLETEEAQSLLEELTRTGARSDSEDIPTSQR
jgi:hypothetical protein